MINPALRQQLAEAAQDVQMRETLTFLYRDQPQGASFDTLQETLCLHNGFDEPGLQALVEDKVLIFNSARYKISAEARQILDRDPVILLDDFLR